MPDSADTARLLDENAGLHAKVDWLEGRMPDAVRVAHQILAEDNWFEDLPAACKDSLSQPNHDNHIARLGRQLAALVVLHNDGGGSGE